MTLTLPIIDLADAAEPTSRPDVARALFDGLAEAALVWVDGHGVPDDVIESMVAVSRRFFALPRDLKAEVEWSGEGLWRGWQPAIEGGSRYGGDTRATDLFERLEANFVPSNGGSDAQGNQWPSQPPMLQSIWERYARALGELSSTLVRLLADALGLPYEMIGQWTHGRSCNLVANYYPAMPPDAVEGRLGLHSHADHSGITVLLPDVVGGLESRSADGTWDETGFRPRAFLVQAGTLLQRWTNGLIPPNVHRVRAPRAESGVGSDRLSIAWFHYPDPTIVVEPAPSCVGVDGARFEPLVAGAYAASRQAAYARGESTVA